MSLHNLNSPGFDEADEDVKSGVGGGFLRWRRVPFWATGKGEEEQTGVDAQRTAEGGAGGGSGRRR